jgi:hypothetical protein
MNRTFVRDEKRPNSEHLFGFKAAAKRFRKA